MALCSGVKPALKSTGGLTENALKREEPRPVREKGVADAEVAPLEKGVAEAEAEALENDVAVNEVPEKWSAPEK